MRDLFTIFQDFSQSLFSSVQFSCQLVGGALRRGLGQRFQGRARLRAFKIARQHGQILARGDCLQFARAFGNASGEQAGVDLASGCEEAGAFQSFEDRGCCIVA